MSSKTFASLLGNFLLTRSSKALSKWLLWLYIMVI